MAQSNPVEIVDETIYFKEDSLGLLSPAQYLDPKYLTFISLEPFANKKLLSCEIGPYTWDYGNGQAFADFETTLKELKITCQRLRFHRNTGIEKDRAGSILAILEPEEVHIDAMDEGLFEALLQAKSINHVYVLTYSDSKCPIIAENLFPRFPKVNLYLALITPPVDSVILHTVCKKAAQKIDSCNQKFKFHVCCDMPSLADIQNFYGDVDHSMDDEGYRRTVQYPPSSEIEFTTQYAVVTMKKLTDKKKD